MATKILKSSWMGLILTTSVLAHGVQAATFTEIGDVGQTLTTAAIPTPESVPLITIFGTLSSSTDADLFLINIIDPVNFSATTVNAETSVDTQLFLLNSSGAAVFLNDDDPAGLGSILQSTLPTGIGPLTAGVYYLGISPFGYDPVNLNTLLFATGSSSTAIVGPNISSPLTGFVGNPFSTPGGSYRINLTGVQTVPEPASVLGLLGMGVWGARRKLKKAKS
ncbi:PEP-CTERM sorting domain-containing protein [Anthocerotibacter panamensis]|uniref:PEP-CTERM sorting domain-containing protein n=1 Tax=Anthocerotibacter panamensis TaxID=2857077 RepID=UPI001C404879|nr:PEP-CTERM sorting domain-containing protein [Anthocerotibacter panamensis]